MKLLALDTSSLACTVGAMNGTQIHSRYEERPREHTRLLMPMIRDVLTESGLAIADLDAIVLGNGPGSFIGLRIAASVAQGLAHGAGLAVAPVSSMAAVALAAGSESDVVAVCEDAHLNEVYLGLYRVGGQSLLSALVPERLQPQTEIAELGELGGVIAAGAGWQRYPALLEQNRKRVRVVSDMRYPRADELLALGAIAVGNGAVVAPADVNPAYLRHEVAAKPQ